MLLHMRPVPLWVTTCTIFHRRVLLAAAASRTPSERAVVDYITLCYSVDFMGWEMNGI